MYKYNSQNDTYQKPYQYSDYIFCHEMFIHFPLKLVLINIKNCYFVHLENKRIWHKKKADNSALSCYNIDMNFFSEIESSFAASAVDKRPFFTKLISISK